MGQVWHILDIMEGSPAQDAGPSLRSSLPTEPQTGSLSFLALTGLVPFGDWVIGYAGGVLKGESELYRVIEAHEDRPLRLFVYNADYEVTREVVIIPNVGAVLSSFRPLAKKLTFGTRCRDRGARGKDCSDARSGSDCCTGYPRPPSTARA